MRSYEARRPQPTRGGPARPHLNGRYLRHRHFINSRSCRGSVDSSWWLVSGISEFLQDRQASQMKGVRVMTDESLDERDKREMDLQLTRELEETFPASDPLTITRFPRKRRSAETEPRGSNATSRPSPSSRNVRH